MALRLDYFAPRDGCEPPSQLLTHDRVAAHRRGVARARRRGAAPPPAASTMQRLVGRAASSSSSSCSPTSLQDQVDAVGRELKDNPDVSRRQVRRQAAGLRGVQAPLPRLARARRHRDARHPPSLVASGAAQHRPERDRGHRRAIREEGRRHVGRVRQGHRRVGHEGHSADCRSASSGAAVVLLVAAVPAHREHDPHRDARRAGVRSRS